MSRHGWASRPRNRRMVGPGSGPTDPGIDAWLSHPTPLLRHVPLHAADPEIDPTLKWTHDPCLDQPRLRYCDMSTSSRPRYCDMFPPQIRLLRHVHTIRPRYCDMSTPEIDPPRNSRSRYCDMFPPRNRPIPATATCPHHPTPLLRHVHGWLPDRPRNRRMPGSSRRSRYCDMFPPPIRLLRHVHHRSPVPATATCPPPSDPATATCPPPADPATATCCDRYATCPHHRSRNCDMVPPPHPATATWFPCQPTPLLRHVPIH